MNGKLKYLSWCARASLDPRRRCCPACGSRQTTLIERKWMVAWLARCRQCQLIYRAPTDSVKRNQSYYETEYDMGYTTDCPSPQELCELVSSRFVGTNRDYSVYLELLKDLGARPGMRLLDFGASWGYGTWQLRDAGYDTVGFEISRSRARYARDELGVTVWTAPNEIEDGFDVHFSSHVIEHVPKLLDTFHQAMTWLKPGGMMVAITPSGCATFRDQNPAAFRKRWGRDSPNLLNKEFYWHAFEHQPRLIASRPYAREAIAAWDGTGAVVVDDLVGDELLFVAKNEPVGEG